MPADDSPAAFRDREFREFFFEAGNKVNRLFDLSFDCFAERIVFFTSPGPVFVVPTVQ